MPEPLTHDPIMDETAPQQRRIIEAGLDIESTHLRGNFGMILCACLKPLGQEPIVLRLDQYKKRKPWEDKPLLADLSLLLEDTMRTYGWYSSRFDIPFIRTRRVLSGFKDTVSFRHSDLLWASRKGLLLHNHRLETLMNTFAHNHSKTDIVPEDWRRAAFGDKEAMDKVVEHCVQDVGGMEEVYLNLLPYVQTWSQVTI